MVVKLLYWGIVVSEYHFRNYKNQCVLCVTFKYVKCEINKNFVNALVSTKKNKKLNRY